MTHILIHADGSTRYVNMIPKGKHVKGDHSKEMKAGDPLSNQTIEGAFSLFKRAVVGNYHKLGVEHMDAYLGEFCWRYISIGNAVTSVGRSGGVF